MDASLDEETIAKMDCSHLCISHDTNHGQFAPDISVRDMSVSLVLQRDRRRVATQSAEFHRISNSYNQYYVKYNRTYGAKPDETTPKTYQYGRKLWTAHQSNLYQMVRLWEVLCALF